MHTTEGPKTLTTEGHFSTSTPQETDPTTETMTVSGTVTPEPTVHMVTTRVILDYSTMFPSVQRK